MNWYENPYKVNCSEKDKKPFHGNQAIPTLMFEKYKEDFTKRFPCLKIVREERMDTVIYPLSGGFHNPSLCPPFLLKALEHIEALLKPLNRYLSFRIFVVLEKV